MRPTPKKNTAPNATALRATPPTQMIAGAPTTDQLDDLDIAADGSLLILMDDAVIQSTAAHQGTVLYALTTAAGFLFPRRLGAIAPGRAAVTDNKGLHVITASSSQLVYDAGQVGSGQGCVGCSGRRRDRKSDRASKKVPPEIPTCAS